MVEDLNTSEVPPAVPPAVPPVGPPERPEEPSVEGLQEAPEKPKRSFKFPIPTIPAIKLPSITLDPQRVRQSFFRGMLVALILFLILLLFYLFVANMAFLGYLPRSLSYQLPFIAGTAQKIAAQEKRIEWAKERLADRRQIRQIGQFDIEVREESDLEGAEQAPPFLYKFRAIRNKVRGKEFAELWIDNVQAMRVLVGQGERPPYARTKKIAQRLYDQVNLHSDFNLLLPAISSGSYRAMLGQQEIFQVSREDAIGLNATPRHLLYQWINNIRVAMGATALAEPPAGPGDDYPAPSFLLPAPPMVLTPNKVEAPTASITTSIQSSVNEAEEAKKRLRKLGEVYDKMDLGTVPPIFARMNDKVVEDIMMYLPDRKLAKLFVAMPPKKVAKYYKEMTGGTMTDEPEKNFRRLLAVWEKIPPEEIMSIWSNLSTPECKRILDHLSVKKKSKVLSVMQVNAAAQFLELMRLN